VGGLASSKKEEKGGTIEVMDGQRITKGV